MINMQKWARIAIIGAGIFGISGCETLDTVKNIFTEPVILACPNYQILADASEILRYVEGGGRDLTDVVSEGEIKDIRLECLTKIDKKTRVGVMEVEVRLIIAASRGPANRSQEAIYPYFISVTDLNKKIVYYEKFNVSIDFFGNRSKLSFASNPITIELPLRPELTGKKYLIYSGTIN